MEPWRTAITSSDDKNIFIRGYDIAALMRQSSFTDTIFLLHKARLPTNDERRLFDAMLIGVSDHGPAAPSAAAARIVTSGNRQALEASIAAGVLAIGDAHGGAGYECMQMIAEAIELGRRESVSLQDTAHRLIAERKAQGRRLPGLGHRVHTEDPRTSVLFAMARESGLAGEGIALMRAIEDRLRVEVRPLPVNVDGALAAVLYDLGFKPPIAKLMFIIGRVAGLTAQVMEEYTRERPMRIRIPVVYDGLPPKETG